MAQSASEMGLRSKHHPLVTREDRRRSSLLRKSSMRMKMKPGDSAESKLTPFYLRWVFGVTNEVRAINLIQPDNPIIFYVGSHAGVLYDVKAKEMRLLHGHKNALESISADSSGRWVATADSGDDNVIIVWDTDSCMPICTIFNYRENSGTRVVGISPNAKYLVAVSKEAHQTVSLWLWTCGRDEPEEAVAYDPDVGKFHKLVFNSEDSCQFALLSDTHVAFITWDEDENNQNLFSHLPEMHHFKNLGTFTDITYIHQTHQVMNATNNGHILIWSDVPYVQSFQKGPTSNTKNLIKVIRVEENSINVLKSVDEIIVTGNSVGEIRFYDRQLLLLYWCQNFVLDPITNISFNILPRHVVLREPEDYFSPNSELALPRLIKSLESPSMSLAHEDRSEEYEQLYRNMVPTDATIEEQPFVARNFIIGTSTGQIGIVDFVKNTCQFILHKSNGCISAIETHPGGRNICIGNTHGELYLYNYRTKELVTKFTVQKIKNSNSSEDQADLVEEERTVSCLKYDPEGIVLACGMASGSLWFLHPISLTPIIENPFKNVKAPIKKMCFSPDSRYMALFDDAKRVCLYHCQNLENGEWRFMGKRRSHYKPIVDILFSTTSSESPESLRLFSLGEDRMLIEYDVFHCFGSGLQVLSEERIEQSAIPLCMIWYPKFNDETYLFISNSEFKLKLLDCKSKMCERTTLGPTFGAPVTLMQIPCDFDKINKAILLFASERFIGIQMLPPDGNPYKSVGMIGHPVRVKQMCLGSNNKYLFTLGEQDSTVHMWYINALAADVMVRIGGENLNPFYSLIEGGEQGWLFQEIRDLFCYAQIIHQGENTYGERACSNKIPLCEIPDLMRAIGFYPSDYEIENMMHEVSRSKLAETGNLVNEIEFEDFVRLYINHHPAFGVPADVLKKSFDTFAYEVTDDSGMTRDAFIDVLLDKGEKLTSEEASRYLQILCPKQWREEATSKASVFADHISETFKSDDEEEAFSFMPEEITYNSFVDDILGINLNVPTEENCWSPI